MPVFLMRFFYHDRIYTDEPKIFYKIYKWDCGLSTLLAFRRIFEIIILELIGMIMFASVRLRMYSMFFIYLGIVIMAFEFIEVGKKLRYNPIGIRTREQIRMLKVEEVIRKHLTTNGKALGKKEWKVIKMHDRGLYRDLLCDECDRACYYYSLEIAKIITDSILIWGAAKEPFEDGEKYYAHAVILRNGYIYDSNMRQSVKYEEFIKLYKFKTYKQWNNGKYSKEGFVKNERNEFKKWCDENSVLKYEAF